MELDKKIKEEAFLRIGEFMKTVSKLKVKFFSF